MATRKRRASPRRRPRQPKTPKTPAPVPVAAPERRVGPIEQKLRAVGEKLLDIAAEDPERVLRMGEGLVDGVNDLYQFFQTHPDQARRTVRDTVISGVAKMAKKKLRESK